MAASCTLEIGGLLVARAEGGPFDAEYALFEAHEIELRSNNEPGTVREHGYVTTAELARERLEAAGVTWALAESVAGEMGALVTGYARGAEVRRVASLLRACELFEGRTWNAQAKAYDGGWIDVTTLAADLALEGSTRAIQALHLAALLHDVKSDAPVVLTTADYTAARRAGERTHRRVSLRAAPKITEAILALAEKRGPRTTREGGATRAELLLAVRTRLAMCANDEARQKLEALEHALAVRERPQRGPLADVELWAVEVQLSEGDTDGAAEKLDALERSRGRQPGTTYLRARLALLVGSEEPRVIAERASSLALSMSAFAELELLAAEAWTRAGERKRALAYARDLADNPQVDAGIRARARALVQGASAPSGERPASIPPPAASTEGAASAVPSTVSAAAPAARPPSSPPASKSGSEPPGPSMVAITTGNRVSYAAPKPAATDDEDDDEDDDDIEAAPDTPIEPLPILDVKGSLVPVAPPIPEAMPDIPPPAATGGFEPPPPEHAPAPAVNDVRVEAQRAPTRPSLRAPIAQSEPPPAPAHLSSSAPDNDEDAATGGVHVKGGSQPPFRTEPPPPNFPAEPIVPRPDSERVERAETLSLPPGLHGESLDTTPTNAMEARIYFTQRSRELGRLYRTRFNVELRTDLRSIEIMQRHLAERFGSGELRTTEDVNDVHMHGAFLSEILARRLGAEWVDLGVSEMGYWSMNVPPGTCVWPIGRVIRFVTMQHRERDLVSYFLELQARAHGLR